MEASPDNEPRDQSGAQEISARLWVPDGDALALIRNREQVVPIIGAGVSQAAGLPGAARLREALMEQFEPHPARGEFANRDDLRHVVNDIINHDRAVAAEVQAFVASFFVRAVEETKTHQISRDLIQVPSRLIVTFNYDRSLEKAAAELGIKCDGLEPGL